MAVAAAVWLASLSSWAQDAPTAGDEAPPMVEVVTLEAALAKMESDAGMTGEVKEMTAFVGQSLHDVAADDAAGQELLAEVQVLTTEFEERVANRQEELGKLATQYSALNQALVALHLD